MTVPEFLATWTDFDVQMHLHYFDVMENPGIREAMQFHEAKKRGKGLKLIEGDKD